MVQFSLVDSLILWTLTRLPSDLVAARPSGGPQSCYYPNGSASNGTVVEGSQADSICCDPGFVGLGNGLCASKSNSQRDHEYTVYRPSCTDSTWKSEQCPKVCRGPQDNLTGNQVIVACSEAGSYCCGRSYNCCSNATDVFQLPVPTSIITASLASDTSQGLSIDAMTTPASATVPDYEFSPSSTSSVDHSSHPSNFPLLGVVLGTVIGAFVVFSFLAAWLLLRRKAAPRPSHQPLSRSQPAPLKSILKSRHNPPLPELENGRLHPGQSDHRSMSHRQTMMYQLVPTTGPDGSPASARTPPAGWPGHPMTPIEVPIGSDTREATDALREMVARASR